MDQTKFRLSGALWHADQFVEGGNLLVWHKQQLAHIWTNYGFVLNLSVFNCRQRHD